MGDEEDDSDIDSEFFPTDGIEDDNGEESDSDDESEDEDGAHGEDQDEQEEGNKKYQVWGRC